MLLCFSIICFWCRGPFLISFVYATAWCYCFRHRCGFHLHFGDEVEPSDELLHPEIKRKVITYKISKIIYIILLFETFYFNFLKKTFILVKKSKIVVKQIIDKYWYNIFQIINNRLMLLAQKYYLFCYSFDIS